MKSNRNAFLSLIAALWGYAFTCPPCPVCAMRNAAIATLFGVPMTLVHNIFLPIALLSAAWLFYRLFCLRQWYTLGIVSVGIILGFTGHWLHNVWTLYSGLALIAFGSYSRAFSKKCHKK